MLDANLLLEWDYEKNGDLNPLQLTPGSNKKVWWKCSLGHEWETKICTRSEQHTNCPYCGGYKVLKGFNDLATTHPELVKEWDYEKNIITPDMAKSTVKYWWKCLKGHSWQADVHHRKMGRGCPICKNILGADKRSKPSRGNDLATVNPDLAYEWNYEKNGSLKPQDVAVKANKKVWWRCKQGHEWLEVVYARSSNHTGCPICSNHRLLIGFNDLATKRPDLAAEWHPTKNGDLKPTDVFSSEGRKVWWLCKNGHAYEASINTRNSINTGCPYCSGSKTERLTYQILKDLGIDYIAEKKFEEYMPVSFYPFDVWIPDKRLIIELDGIQHFTGDIEFFENTPYAERRKHDNLKNNFCLENHIPILRIPYDISPDSDADVIKFIVEDFVNNHIVHDLIIEYYSAYSEDNNYAEVATKLNEWVKKTKEAEHE